MISGELPEEEKEQVVVEVVQDKPRMIARFQNDTDSSSEEECKTIPT